MSSAATTCSLAEGTLSFACDGACSQTYHPCLKTASILTTATHAYKSSKCDYECFRYNATATFALYIPYGTTYKSPQELAGTFTSELKNAPNDTANWPSENNDKLTKIAQLVLPATASIM